jgi:hypothetical protein
MTQSLCISTFSPAGTATASATADPAVAVTTVAVGVAGVLFSTRLEAPVAAASAAFCCFKIYKNKFFFSKDKITRVSQAVIHEIQFRF